MGCILKLSLIPEGQTTQTLYGHQTKTVTLRLGDASSQEEVQAAIITGLTHKVSHALPLTKDTWVLDPRFCKVYSDIDTAHYVRGENMPQAKLGRTQRSIEGSESVTRVVETDSIDEFAEEIAASVVEMVGDLSSHRNTNKL